MTAGAAVQASTACLSCGHSVVQGGRGRRRLYCSDRCRRRAHRERVDNAAHIVPLRSRPAIEGLEAQVARPRASTADDVARTLLEAGRVCAELRHHAVAASPQLALRCELVAAALDNAIAEQFGDLLTPP